jgi:hypothetical protein
MKTTTKLFVVGLTLVIFGLPGHANEDAEATWTPDANGCKVWNWRPVAGETVTWSGACKDGYAEGPGIVQWQHGDKPGSRTEAPFIKGKPSGKGSRVSSNGGRFEGSFVDGEASGKGVYAWPNGDRYTGDFAHDAPAGVGVLERTDGDRYEGDFVDWKRTGKGVGTTSAGTRYEGEWLDDKRNGTGTQIFADGSRYTGQWKDNKPLNPESIERKTYSMKRTCPGRRSSVTL